MSEPVVRSSSRLWSQEVAAARASEELDYALPGDQGVAALTRNKQVAYEFGGGARKFYDKTNPYA